MFTGLIETIGRISHQHPLKGGIAVTISCKESFASSINVGDSISVNGVCSTATSKTDTTFCVNYLNETLSKTTFKGSQINDAVNLEHCLRLNDKIGGHIVSGHVDDTGQIESVNFDGTWGILQIAFNPKWSPFIIPKGSISIDGISLTIVEANASNLTCHLIPHTIKHTILHKKKPGDDVNLEFDQIGKYVHRFTEHAKMP